MSPVNDKYLIDGILKEDASILKHVYSQYFPGILSFVISGKGNREEAKDIFQDALVAIFMKARKNPGFLTSSFKTYIFKVSKYLWLKEKRRKMRSALNPELYIEELNDEYEDIIQDLIEMEKNKLVWKYFSELNEDCQKILKLAIDSISLDKITELMGYSSVQYTKNRKTGCKNSLVKKIRSSQEFKELKNESVGENTALPRW